MKKFFKIFLVILLLFVVAGTFVLLWKGSQPREVVYEIVTVGKGTITNTSVATGKIAPRDEVLIKPQIAGIVAELHKEAGDLVRAGEVIATIKVIPDMNTLSAAESRLRLAEIARGQATTEYERQKRLFAKEIISGKEMETADTEYRRALEEFDIAAENLEITRDGISSRSAQSSSTQVRSTIDGMILDIPVKVGNTVVNANTFNDGTTIASVANMGDMLFVGKVDETDVGRIRAGMPITLTVGAMREHKFDAVLEYISPKGVEENGAVMFEIKAAATIPDSVIVRAGYSANAQIVLGLAEDVLTVAESVVSFSGDSTFVYVLQDGGKGQVFDKRPVVTGLSDGINVEVREGVGEGMKLRGNLLSNNNSAKQ